MVSWEEVSKDNKINKDMESKMEEGKEERTKGGKEGRKDEGKEEFYDLQIEKVVSEIKESGAKRVLIQLPDGLKPRAKEIFKEVKEKFPDVKVVFWGGSCFGSCDLPRGMEKLGFDLLLHFGHTEWE